MGSMNLDPAKARLKGTPSGDSESGADPLQPLLIQGLRPRHPLREGDIRSGPNWTPTSLVRGQQASTIPRLVGAGLSASVGKLDAWNGPLVRNEFRNWSPSLRMAFLVQTRVRRTYPPSRFHGRGLGHDEGRSPNRAGPEMHHMPIVRNAVLRAVHAHRGNGDAVFQLNVTNFKRGEEVGHLSF
jgi:hypothetical protein